VVWEIGERVPAIDADPIDLRHLLLNLVLNASEALGDNGGTITVTGGVTHPRAITGATVTLTRKLKADDSTVEVLVNDTADLTAGVQLTWATILGAACTFTPATAQEEYLEAAISGGTPAVTTTTSGQFPYVVIPAFTVPTLAVADDGDGSVTVAVTNNAGQTCRLKYRYSGETDWTVGNSVTGNGAITGPTGLNHGTGTLWYAFQAVPYESTGLEGEGSNFVFLHLEDSSATATTSALDDELTDSLAQLFAELGRTITYNPSGGTPAEVTAVVALDESPFLDEPESGRQTWRGQVRLKATDATAPGRRDTFTIDGVAYAAANEPRARAGAVLYQVERTVTVRRDALPRRGER
jgi:hypothetical protein